LEGGVLRRSVSMPVILGCFCMAAMAGGRVKRLVAAAAVAVRNRKSRRVVAVVGMMVLGSDLIRSLAAAWVPRLGVYRFCLFS
jgi:hypothetical protein